MVCGRCGDDALSIVLYKGEFLCRPCHGDRKGLDSAPGIITDDIPGGMWLENYGPNKIKVYSHTERRALMNRPRRDKTTGQPYVLTEKENFAPMPGTDKDAQGIPNPEGYRDLSAAAIIMRNGRPSAFDGTDSVDALSGGSARDTTDSDDIPNEPGFLDPRVHRGEFSPTDPAARAFLKKVIGD